MFLLELQLSVFLVLVYTDRLLLTLLLVCSQVDVT